MAFRDGDDVGVVRSVSSDTASAFLFHKLTQCRQGDKKKNMRVLILLQNKDAAVHTIGGRHRRK